MAEAHVAVPGYSNLVEVGRGGFGVVYRAEQGDVHRVVAIKVLSGFDEEARGRFDRERDAMGLLSSHPNIVTVFASGFAGDNPYLVMEFLDRGSLADRLARAPIAWPDAVDIGVKLAGALQAAHEEGILHRDVKPENVLVSSYGEPKLADFGIARFEGGPETRSGVFTASLLHAAPEVLAGRRPTAASDVYSLASTIFALLAGYAPFHRDTDESIVPLFARAATEPVPDLRTQGIPAAVCDVVERGLAKDPAARPASAAEFGQLLRDAQRALGLEATAMVIPSTDHLPDGSPAERDQPGASTNILDAPPVLPTDARPVPPAPEPEKRRRRVALLSAIGGMAAILLIIAGVAVFSGGGSDGSTTATTGQGPGATNGSSCRSVRWSVHNGSVTPAESPPEAEVSPCTDLHDKQVVRVRAAGFSGQQLVFVYECFYPGGAYGFDQALGAAGGQCNKLVRAGTPEGENPPGVVDVDIAGTAELNFPVKVGPWGDGTIPCTEPAPKDVGGGGQCALVVTSTPEDLSLVSADPVFLTFAESK